ncbi:MAG: OmpA family protein [Bacteroidota bacterium]
MRNTLAFLFLFLCIAAFAQQTVTVFDLDFDKAKVLFLNKKYNTAAGAFKKIYPKAPDEEKKSEVLFYIAESYRLSNNFKQAFDWYEQLINTKYPDPKILYSYGLLLKNFERYDDAARLFGDYLFEVPGNKNAEREIQACRIAGGWKLTPQKFSINNIKELNTPYSDYSPYLSQGKLTWSSARTESTGNIIFEWTGQKCADIFEAPLNNGSVGSLRKVPGLVNSNYNEGVAWLDSTNTTMYFTQCNGTDGKGLNCKIYVSYNQNNQWSAPQVLPFCSDSFSTGHPAFSPDMKRLFFASNMPGSFGEKDVYYIDYNPITTKWGTPVNLGPNVNSTEDDMFPYAHNDGKIYFSSKGHYGMGGLDLFYTTDSAGTFSKAQNLRSPINSGGDDFGISFTNETDKKKPVAYYSSNREGGQGDDDLYTISIKPYIFLVKGTVIDRESGSPLSGVSVSITSQDVAPLIVKTGGKGDFITELGLNNTFTLSGGKEKYFRSSEQLVSTRNIITDTTIEVKIYLDPIPDEGVEFTLQGIYYDVDKSDIRPDAAKVLDSLVVILKNNPSLLIELASHTDSRAEEEYNLKLSQRRAQSCVDYLVKKGIAKDRLKAVGYGESKLVNDCVDGVDCTEEQHQENRRTTFRVLSTDYKGKG